MDKPFVSVITTAYNREKYLAEAIESVLASTYTNFELIICDDCSTDKTLEIAKGYAARDHRIKVFANKHNLGDYKNRNKAASYASGEYLKYLDSDDLIYKYSLEAFVDFMESDKEAAIGITYRGAFTTQPFPVVLHSNESVRHHFFIKEFMNCTPSGTIFRRRCFEEAGGFAGKTTIDDMALSLKLALKHKVMLLPPCIFFWREHEEQEMAISKRNNVFEKLYKDLAETQINGLPEEILTKEEQQKIRNRYIQAEKVSRRKLFLRKMFGAAS
jgi:glycosyltransferase involved in cell wall biosynthesis